MHKIISHPLKGESKRYLHSVWVVENGLEGIRQQSAVLKPFGYPYIHIKAGKSNELEYRNRSYHYNDLVAGQLTRPTAFRFYMPMDAFYIRLNPWVLPNLTGQSAHLMADTYTSLADINEPLSRELQALLASGAAAEEQGREIERLLVQHMYPIDADPRVLKAFELIKSSYGMVRVNDIVDELAVSPRRLQQLFGYHVGISPKKITNIYRLHKILYDVVNGQYPISAYDSHYDQAHFINDFKKMTDMSLARFKDVTFTEEEKRAALRVNLYLEDEQDAFINP